MPIWISASATNPFLDEERECATFTQRPAVGFPHCDEFEVRCSHGRAAQRMSHECIADPAFNFQRSAMQTLVNAAYDRWGHWCDELQALVDRYRVDRPRSREESPQ